MPYYGSSHRHVIMSKMVSPEGMCFVVSRLVLINAVSLIVFVALISNVYSKQNETSAVHSPSLCVFSKELSKLSCDVLKLNDSTKTAFANITGSLCQVLVDVSTNVCNSTMSGNPFDKNKKSNETCKMLSESTGFDWSRAEVVRNMTKDDTLCNEICSASENLTNICNVLALSFQILHAKPDVTPLVISSTPSSTITHVTNGSKDHGNTLKVSKTTNGGKSKTPENVMKSSQQTEVTTTNTTTASTESTTRLPKSTSTVSATKPTMVPKKMTDVEQKKVKVVAEEEGETKLDVPMKNEDEEDADPNDPAYGDDDTGEDDETIVKLNRGKDKDLSFEDPTNERSKEHPIGTFSSGYDDGDSHFFVYFLTVVGMCIAMYVLFHNKQKILAIIVEGRQDRRNRRPNSNLYRKLDTNLEEVIQDNRPKNVRSMSNVIY